MKSLFWSLCNFLSEYKFGDSSTLMSVHTQTGNLRTILIPYLAKEHPFVDDFYHDISLGDAEKHIKNMMDRLS